MSLDFTVRNIKMVKTECVQCADNFSAVKAHILTQHFYKKRFFSNHTKRDRNTAATVYVPVLMESFRR